MVEKKEKELSDIAPLWSKVLKDLDNIDRKLMDDKELDIGSFQTCIVGEAYHFNEDYVIPKNKMFCSECGKIAHEFGVLLTNPLCYRKSLHERRKIVYRHIEQKFIDHWNEKHL